MPRPVLLAILLISFSGYGQRLPLFNGPEYINRYHGVSGHPYIEVDTFTSGSLLYDGIFYANVLLNFNIADNQVVTKEPDQGYLIRLVSDKIDFFILNSRRFERVPGPDGSKFYEILYQNGVKLFAERYKQVRSSLRAEEPLRFAVYVRYFVPQGGRLQAVRRLRDVEESMKPDSLIKQYLPQQNDPAAVSPLSKKKFEENRLHTIGSNTTVVSGRLTLAGYVKDARSGEPVPGAMITVDSSSIFAVTDQFGYYSIELGGGRHLITLSGAGISDVQRHVEIQSDGKLDIETMPEIGSLKAVVVTAEKTSRVRNPQMSVEKLTIKTIKQVPVVFGEADVLRVVTTLPGVTTTGEAGTGFNVRGGSTDQNLILFNDATIYNPSHLFGFFSAFNPDIIKSVELYKSSIPYKFGGRLSSVLDITSRAGNRKEMAGSGGIGPLTSKLSVEGPISFRNKKREENASASFIASVRNTYSNWLLRALPNERYNNSRASFQDVTVGVNFDTDKKNSIFLTGYFSSDRFRLNNDTSYSYGNVNGNIKWKHIFNNKFYSVFSAGYDHYNYGIEDDRVATNAFELKFDINQAWLRTDFSYALSNKHELSYGMQHNYYKLHPGSFTPKSAGSLVNTDILQAEQALETGFYVGDKYSVNNNLSIDAGVRYTVFNYLGPNTIDEYSPATPKDSTTIIRSTAYAKNRIIRTFHAPEFRASARYTLSNNSSFKLAFNTTRQYIHMLSNTIIISPTDTWKLSDNNIRPQQCWQGSVGYYQNFLSNTIEGSIEWYYKQIKNVLDFKSGARLVMNHHIAADVIAAKGKSYGGELMIRKVAGKLNGWLSYTYSRTFLRQNDSLAGETINNGDYYPASFDKPHSLNIIGNYRFTHRVSLSINVVYATGRPVTVPEAIFELGGAQRVYYSERNQYRIADYFRADASFTLEGNHKTKQRIHNSWSFGVYNISARKNPYSVYFKQEDGVIKGYQMSIFGTIIPFVTYNFRF